MLSLLLLLTILQAATADISCFNGDILRKGSVKTPSDDDARGCRIHFEMMDDVCDVNKVDIVAGRTGSAGNETMECEYVTGDNMVECECATDKCNTPSMNVKEGILAILGGDQHERAVIDCFVKVLESKFGLTTTSTTTTTTTTTTKAAVPTGNPAKPNNTSGSVETTTKTSTLQQFLPTIAATLAVTLLL